VIVPRGIAVHMLEVSCFAATVTLRRSSQSGTCVSTSIFDRSLKVGCRVTVFVTVVVISTTIACRQSCRCPLSGEHQINKHHQSIVDSQLTCLPYLLYASASYTLPNPT